MKNLLITSSAPALITVMLLGSFAQKPGLVKSVSRSPAVLKEHKTLKQNILRYLVKL